MSDGNHKQPNWSWHKYVVHMKTWHHITKEMKDKRKTSNKIWLMQWTSPHQLFWLSLILWHQSLLRSTGLHWKNMALQTIILCVTCKWAAVRSLSQKLSLKGEIGYFAANHRVDAAGKLSSASAVDIMHSLATHRSNYLDNEQLFWGQNWILVDGAVSAAQLWLYWPACPSWTATGKAHSGLGLAVFPEAPRGI